MLPNGIDVARWRRPEGLADVMVPPLRIVAAQRMVRRKRPDALIDLLLRARELVPSGIALQAEVVGDGPAREGLVRRLEVDGVDWISLPGRVTRKQLRDLHWRSHVFVSAARLEAFGIAALEARTAGLALVVREGTGARDFVSMGLSGLLADKTSVPFSIAIFTARERSLEMAETRSTAAENALQPTSRVLSLPVGMTRS